MKMSDGLGVTSVVTLVSSPVSTGSVLGCPAQLSLSPVHQPNINIGLPSLPLLTSQHVSGSPLTILPSPGHQLTSSNNTTPSSPSSLSSTNSNNNNNNNYVNTQNMADYLAQLIKDKKQLAIFPNLFLHVERILDEGNVQLYLFSSILAPKKSIFDH